MNYEAANLRNHLLEILGKDPDHTITSTDIVENYLNTNVPVSEVVYIYLALTPEQRENQVLLVNQNLLRAFDAGYAINKYINEELAQEHPTDKRFLLRSIENLCDRHGLSSHKCPGYGHDVIYSTKPIPYTTFDNSLYIPPRRGYWAIVSKSGTARD